MRENENYKQAVEDEMYPDLNLNLDLDFNLPFPEKDEKIGGNYSSKKAEETSEAAEWRKKAAEWKKKAGQLKNRLQRFAGWKKEAEDSREEMKKMNARNRKLMGDLSEKDEQISRLKREIAKLKKDSRIEIAAKMEEKSLNPEVKKLLENLPPAVREKITAAADGKERSKKVSFLMEAAVLIARESDETKNTFVAIVKKMGFSPALFGF